MLHYRQTPDTIIHKNIYNIYVETSLTIGSCLSISHYRINIITNQINNILDYIVENLTKEEVIKIDTIYSPYTKIIYLHNHSKIIISQKPIKDLVDTIVTEEENYSINNLLY